MPPLVNEDGNDEEFVEENMKEIVSDQQKVEKQFDEIAKEKEAYRGMEKSVRDARDDAHDKMTKTGKQLKDQMFLFGQGLRQNPLAPDNIQKVQEDRGFLEKVLQDTLTELCGPHSFQVLIDAVESEKEKKARLTDIILREEESRRRIKALQKRILEVKREREVEINDRNQMIAHLKDQLQEMKAKTSMEGKYIQKCADVQVAQTQKK